MAPLQADLHISSRAPINMHPQEGCEWLWSGLANTLIHNDQFALLVDTSITITQNKDLIEWIKSVLGDNQRLTHIFITHAHKDHYLGIPTLLDAFPDLNILTTEATIRQMKIHDQNTKDLWPSTFPNNQLDLRDAWTATPIPQSGTFSIPDTPFHAVTVSHGDYAHPAILHVPSLSLVCAGDVVIATHLYLGEADTPAKREQWLSASGHTRGDQFPGGKVMVQDTRVYLGFGRGRYRCVEMGRRWGRV